MPRVYKITRLPEGYCKLAIAAWKSLPDYELFEIEGKLVYTDDIASYLEEETEVMCMTEVFDSHFEFERWLLKTVVEWIEHDPLMLDDLDEHIKLA